MAQENILHKKITASAVEAAKAALAKRELVVVPAATAAEPEPAADVVSIWDLMGRGEDGITPAHLEALYEEAHNDARHANNLTTRAADHAHFLRAQVERYYDIFQNLYDHGKNVFLDYANCRYRITKINKFLADHGHAEVPVHGKLPESDRVIHHAYTKLLQAMKYVLDHVKSQRQIDAEIKAAREAAAEAEAAGE